MDLQESLAWASPRESKIAHLNFNSKRNLAWTELTIADFHTVKFFSKLDLLMTSGRNFTGVLFINVRGVESIQLAVHFFFKS